MKKSRIQHHAERIISLLMVICLMFAFLPTVAFADDTDNGKMRITCQDNAVAGGSVFYKLSGDENFRPVTATNSQYDSIALNNSSAITIKFVVTQGYQLDAGRGVTLRVNGTPDVFKSTDANINQFTSDEGYTIQLSELVGTSSVAGSSFELEFGFVKEGGSDDPPIDWHTVSWGGGNVKVEHGSVLAERVHLGDKVFTVNPDESGKSEEDNIYPIEDIIGEEGQEGLGTYGLGYSDTDLFIDNDVTEAVSIDFKFVPDYGYQLDDILTNETESLLKEFTASAAEISTFNFAVKKNNGNVHFNVQFKESPDTVELTNTTVTDASIANGENATDSGNLKMTVAGVDKTGVSDELKAQSGETAVYLDMNLYQVVSKGGENGNWENQLTELDGTITVSLRVPAPAQGNTYYIVREHGDGEDKTYDRIEATFVPDEGDPTVGTVTFETNKFSTYALSQIVLKSEINTTKVTSTTVVADSWTDALRDTAPAATEVKMTVDDFTAATNESKAKFASASRVTPNADKSFYLDINLLAKVGGSDTQITELNDKVTVTLTVPAISATEQYTVVREHSGAYEKLDSTFNRQTNTLQFQSDKFSTYAILVSTIPDVVSTQPEPANSGNAVDRSETAAIVKPAQSRIPQTGDTANPALWVVLMCSSFAGMVGTAVSRRRRQHRLRR